MNHIQYKIFKNYGYIDEDLIAETDNLNEAEDIWAGACDDAEPNDIIELAYFKANGTYHTLETHQVPEEEAPWI